MGAVKEPGPGDSRRLDDELERARRGEGPLVTGPGQQVTQRHSGEGKVRQQHIKREQPPKRGPQVVDMRSRPPLAPEQTQTPGQAMVTVPVRTVVYVEVGGMDQAQVWELCRQYANSYEGSVHGPHYVIPVRDGRLRTEVEFEEQFLQTVRELCEVRDGQIQLRDGARRVQVMRTHVEAEG